MRSDIVLRAAVPVDAAAIAAIYAPYVTGSATSFEDVAPTAATVTTRMMDTPRLPWLVAIDGDAVVGYAYAGLHRSRAAYRWSADVSVYLAVSHCRSGLGTALYERLLPELRSLGYVSAYAGIALPNPASERSSRAPGHCRTTDRSDRHLAAPAARVSRGSFVGVGVDWFRE